MQNAELMHYRNQYAEKLCRKILYAKTKQKTSKIAIMQNAECRMQNVELCRMQNAETAEKPECRMHVVQNCRNAEK